MSRFGPLLPLGGPRSIVDPTAVDPGERPTGAGGPTFDDILAGRLEAGGRVTLSAHAQQALAAERIELSPLELDRIGRAMDRIAEAGGREGLLVTEKGAFAVSVPDRTVVSVTAADQMRDTVFTRIDSAVLIDG